MLAAIDAYFSASDGTEEEVAENLLLDVRDEINKQQSKAQPAPVQEPAAWAVHYNGPIPLFTKTKAEAEAWGGNYILPLYTTPLAAQRTWVGLTDEERDAITVMRTAKWRNRFRNHAKAVEQLLKEKNHD
jgi:hypothetical protein